MDDDRSRDDEGEDPRPIARRDFLKAGVVGAVVLSVPGCGSDAMTPLSDGGARDASSPDGGTPIDAARDGGSDAGPAIEQVPPPEGVAESAMFDMGVASGDVTTTAAVLWTHHAGSGPLELVVWEMDGGTYARTVHVGEIIASEGFVHVDVAVLAPAARYRFAFFEAGRAARSTIGRFRTPAAEGVRERLVIGAVSCVSNTRDIPTIGHAGNRTDLDVFLYLGDSSYNDGASDVASYREKWRSNLTRPEYVALRRATSCLATWDDHEFDNNFDPESFDATSLAAAEQTFFEHQPLRRDPASPDRVWKRMRWGATLEVFVLDSRSERRPSTRSGPDAEYLSRAQMDWLKAGLLESPAVFKIIANSVPISDMPGPFDLQQQDRWEGYPAQRAEILTHIDANAIPGVLWLAGDFHLASAGKVGASAGDPGGSQVEILAGPGAQTGNLLATFLRDPQFQFSSTENNYTVLELDPETTRIRAYWINGSGSVIETLEYDLS